MRASHSVSPPLLRSCGCVLLGCALTAFGLQTILGMEQTALTLMSRELWHSLVGSLGGRLERLPDGGVDASIGFVPLFVVLGIAAAFVWPAGAWWIARRTRRPFRDALREWGLRGWVWWMLPGVWSVGWLTAFLIGWTSLEALLLATPQMWLALALAGWGASWIVLSRTDGKAVGSAVSAPAPSPPAPLPGGEGSRSGSGIPQAVWIAAGLYAVIYVAMNWQLYFGLRIPHGDSAMYEEHLWNITHGKGFRSYLDQGLFLGEHIQIIHLLLIPLHLVWPSHLLLELCESLALASGAIPVFLLARRHTGSSKMGTLLACAYLLYFPMQFLDIAVDLKTFRPEAFGIPVLLFALDQMERGRYRTMLLLFAVALSAREDFALVLAPLGAWLFLTALPDRGGGRLAGAAPPSRKRRLITGAGLALFGVLYVVAVTRWVLPWFRGGAEIHYAGYFSRFGSSMGEIIWNLTTNPALLIRELVTVQTVVYALALLLPLGFLPLRSPGRLAVGLPMFVILCLNELARDPRHHFHAPLVPIVLWAAAAGLGGLPAAGRLFSRRFAGHFAWTSALATGLFFSLGPLGIPFWDAGSSWHWRALYIPGERAEMFPRVEELIPRDSRVASTDFIHPRFTHHERSYDYSEYRRRVSEYQEGVPPDTDYIVIDTRHPYSEIKQPEQIREYREEPDQWELLPDRTEGYFIVLKRKDRRE